MKIALDAYGSDNCPFAEVEGAVLAIKENVCEKIFLVGKEDELSRHLDKYIYDKSRIEIVHACDVISMEEEASQAARKKKNSSMVTALQLHKDKIASAAVSAGNTGAMMAASLFTYGRIKNVSRPAIALTFPTVYGQEIVLDVGANVDCEPQHLEQFAVLGSLYAKFLFEIESPKVSLLNIGEESKKGNELTKAAYNILSQSKDINFIGNIEGKDLLKGITDVVVCDGFVGNVMLKSVEGAAIAIFDIMKEQMKKDWIAKLGALLSYPVYKYLKTKLDHTEYGGALLVGLNGISVVGHGRSNAKAIKNAVKFAAKISETAFIQQVKEHFERN
ncbi:MAG: phosphate acyltransferase PlsX [Candidatus Cloacimonadales bacterium]|jgi:glycerol-3-phosphate acyltransferase PlsX|nr:phosphate acyltransferase PlsX [Candidatus Cloacimonadota bacterium]MDD2649976.1 phosphate acyltransferase PlsX [Candidatus Cloacimonadota bacterium]MDX9976504.1 phosphate acyltransferase PlsX [Candidatus Cloacimonadales bacterium]